MGYCSSRLLVPSVIVVVICAGAHPSLADTAIIDFERAMLGSEHEGFLLAFSSDSTIGWSFTPLCDIWVTDLGFIDEGIGLSMQHAVGIWNGEGELVTSTVLGGTRSSGTIAHPGSEPPLWPRLHEGEYLYATIDPLSLDAGESYVVGATVPLFSPVVPCVEGWVQRGDTYPLAVVPGSLVVDPHISIREPALVWRGVVGADLIFGPGELHLPDETFDGGTFVGVNFQFTVVPEPPTVILVCGAVLGLMMLRRTRSVG